MRVKCLLALVIFSGWTQAADDVGALVRQLNDSFAAVYEKVVPAVVVIDVQGASDATVTLPQGLELFFRGPYGPSVPSRDQGSGFLISEDGYILTSDHVVAAAEAGQVTVTLRDGRKFPARLVGRDPRSDLAVLKIDGKGLPTVELGDSDAVKVGNFAFAIGAPFDLPYTFTVGVISAKARTNITGSRTYEEYIQTDASINPGNSGGPLCDIDGKVIGVNALISTTDRGMGFAVPIRVAREVSAQLIAQGRVARPWLGIGIMGLDDSETLRSYFPTLQAGVFVHEIEPNTPAAASDLRRGDVILKVDNVAVAGSRDLQREILNKKIGAPVQLEVWRGGKTLTVSLQTAEQPDRLRTAAFRAAPQDPPKAPPATGQPGLMGLTVEDVPSRGVVVSAVEEGSPAAAAGLRPGDVISEAGGKPVRSHRQLAGILTAMDTSRGVMLFIERDGQRTFAILKP